ncbi:hypothetical protein [Magnetococcus marinus]|uniref:hypothetical protein n=1 Tax=Magnetococcus marinus TaxID=1124597 RepID=UPI0002D5DE7D|nr:hypothetical protein [Magnetococcus marinus]
MALIRRFGCQHHRLRGLLGLAVVLSEPACLLLQGGDFFLLESADHLILEG